MGHRRRNFLVIGLAALVLASTGCGGTQSSANDAKVAMGNADQRLQGSWVLVDFQPNVALEPMLAQLLSMQLGHLTVGFNRGQMVATGMAVQARRTYTITSATMNDFTATLYDDAGVAYDARCSFDGDRLLFEALTPPWTGRGTLQRATQ